MLWGREDTHSVGVGGRGRKRGHEINVRVAWGCHFLRVRTPVNYAQKGASSCNAVVR